MGNDNGFPDDINENDDIKPIDLASKPPIPIKGRLFNQEKAKPEEFIDPIRDQQKRDDKSEAARREKLRNKDSNIPEHMMKHMTDHVIADNQLVEKGAYIDLLKKVPFLRSLHIGVGWDQKAIEAEPIDIDLSAFLLNKSDQTRDDGDFVFYNQLSACDGAIKHDGDQRTGAGQGDDETMFVDLNGIPYDVIRIMFVISIYDENLHGDHFGMVRNLYIRLVNKEDGIEMCRFPIEDDGSEGDTAILAAALVREGPRWYFEALGKGVGRGGLAAVAKGYGMIVKELQSSGL